MAVRSGGDSWHVVVALIYIAVFELRSLRLDKTQRVAAADIGCTV